MTIEIDVILGNTKNQMKHLGKNTNDEDDDDDKKSKTKKDPKGEGGVAEVKQCKKEHFSLDHENLDLNSVESNRKKINLLEETMNNFFKIFTSNSQEEVNETI